MTIRQTDDTQQFDSNLLVGDIVRRRYQRIIKSALQLRTSDQLNLFN